MRKRLGINVIGSANMNKTMYMRRQQQQEEGHTCCVGWQVGCTDGRILGCSLGCTLGCIDGHTTGCALGWLLG